MIIDHHYLFTVNHIAVVGTSQGGYIAQYVSYYEKNMQLKFVIIGASFKDDSLEKDKNFRLYGKILSITEKSDDGHVPMSHEQRFIRSHIKDFKEIELNTGLNHGFLFKALNDWIAPAKDISSRNSFFHKTVNLLSHFLSIH
ncbi:hypothetical protein [Chryseobacterium sp.]|uniref:hypothetical protein n=1 Tax=Chryseobacterium sp. TaxID=1871047 RepID=UPI0035B25647